MYKEVRLRTHFFDSTSYVLHLLKLVEDSKQGPLTPVQCLSLTVLNSEGRNLRQSLWCCSFPNSPNKNPFAKTAFKRESVLDIL